MKAPWNEPRGYRTLAERQADPLYVEEGYDEDVQAAWAKHLALKSDRKNEPLFLVGHEATQEARREDARMFLAIGFFIGAAFGFIVGVWLATH